MKEKWKIVGLIVGIFILAVGLFLGPLVIKIRNTKTKASGITLSFSTSGSQINQGDTFTVVTAIDTSALAVSAADIRIVFDGSKLQAQKIEAIGNFLPVTFLPGVISTSSGRIVVAAAANTTKMYTKSGLGILAQITFKAVGSGSTVVSFDPGTAIASVDQQSNAVGQLNPLNLNITAPSPTPTTAPTSLVVYQLSKGTDTIFTIVPTGEVINLPKSGWTLITASFKAWNPQKDLNMVPLYRFYNPNAGHFFSSDPQEKTNLLSWGYTLEGISFYVYNSPQPGTIPVYRLYKSASDHVWTSSATKRDAFIKNGYISEGVKFYAASP